MTKPLARVSSLTVAELRAATSELLFEERPIEIGKFKMGARSATPIGRPTIEGWKLALEFACASHQASPYWIGDLMAYSESREDWKAKLDQMMEVSGLAAQTIKNLGYISRHVEEPERKLAPTIGHSNIVAPLPREQQTVWLEKARLHGWTVRELQLEVRASKRRLVIEGQAVLEGLYRVIYADPPWSYGRAAGVTGAQDHYPGMEIAEMCKLPVAAHAHESAVLFMWTTAPMLYENPGPREVIEAWGFKPKTGIVWDKVEHNFGNYVSVRHEHLIIATRGSCTPDRPTPMLDSVVTERPDPTHSKKPESFRKMIERLYDGPYLELFGREPREGWRVFGNDARLWANQAQEQSDAQRVAS